jgi:hypothetical protein
MQEQTAEQVKTMREHMAEQARMIATLTAALDAKQDQRKHIQLSTGGEVVELVNAADVRVLQEACEESAAAVKALEKRVGALEVSNEPEVAKTETSFAAVETDRGERKDANPYQAAQPPPPPPRPVATPSRRLSSSSGGDSVNELSITGLNVMVSLNSRMPGLTSFNCTGVGDGKMTCSGPIHASDFVLSDGSSLSGVLLQLTSIAAFVDLYPPAPPVPPSAPPHHPPPTPYDTCRLIITAIRQSSQNDVQFLEWFLYSDADLSNAIALTLDSYHFCPLAGHHAAGQLQSCNGASWGQGGDKALDGIISSSSKAYCEAPHKSQCGVVLQATFLPTPHVKGYDIISANAMEGRDPTSWQIDCRGNDEPWTTLDTVANFAAPSARYTSYGPFLFPPAPPPPAPPTLPSPPCPWATSSTVVDQVGCNDGSFCNRMTHGWNCCGVGNRAQCPKHFFACHNRAGNGVDFSCWLESEGACHLHGGYEPCPTSAP